jgi:hypothetical protein
MRQTQRGDDDGVIAYLKILGFVVQGTDEYSSVYIAKGKDLILMSESGDALDVGAKYRNGPVPPTAFEHDLLADLDMTGLETDVDTGTLERSDYALGVSGVRSTGKLLLVFGYVRASPFRRDLPPSRQPYGGR